MRMIVFPSEVTDNIGVAIDNDVLVVMVGGVLVPVSVRDALVLAAAIAARECTYVSSADGAVEVAVNQEGEIGVGCFNAGGECWAPVGPDAHPMIVKGLCDAVAVMESAADAAEVDFLVGQVVQVAHRMGATAHLPLHLIAAGMAGVAVDV